MIYKHIFWVYFGIFFFSSCGQNPLDISPTKKDLPIQYVNLDSIFRNTPENKLKLVLDATKLHKNEIISYQLHHCLGVGSLSDTGTPHRIKLFLKDPFISRLEQRIAQNFSQLTTRKNNILKGFLFLNHHFPKGKLPASIIFMNSFFASNVFCTEHEIGIGLERYLGPETDVIKELPSQEFFQWVKDRMKAEYLERDVLYAWIMTHYVEENQENIAAAMVRWGKVLYLTEAAFPSMPAHLLLRYSQKDFDWCLQNESPFWRYLVQQKLLFSKNEREMANFLQDGPFTIGLPEKGPDRLGQFLGWRIVHAYMKANPDIRLEELVKTKYTKILQAYEME